MLQKDGIVHFKGGKSAGDQSSKSDSIFSFYQNGPFSTQDEFTVNSFGRQGYSVFEIGDGRRLSHDKVNITIECRDPYRIRFSGTYYYYDDGEFKKIQVTDGLLQVQ